MTSPRGFGRVAMFLVHPLLRLSYSSPHREHANRKYLSRPRMEHTPSMPGVLSSAIVHTVSSKPSGRSYTSFPPYPNQVLPLATGTNLTPLRTHCGVPLVLRNPCQGSRFQTSGNAFPVLPVFSGDSVVPSNVDKPYIFHSLLLSIALSGAD